MLDPAAVYFTWPDRRLAYTCAGCGACCKGLGIGLDVAGGQLAALTARRPEIVPFLRRRGDAITLWNPRDRCWFLEDDGLCRVEVEDGRAAKPASCRLFPFNRVFTLGAVTVVDYNSVICPLVVGGAAPVAPAAATPPPVADDDPPVADDDPPRCYPYLPTPAGACPTTCATRADCAGSRGPGDFAEHGWPLDCINARCVPLAPEHVHP